ncbi:MAG: hypothetical protein U0768_07845 [Anaerolineae bacterium]
MAVSGGPPHLANYRHRALGVKSRANHSPEAATPPTPSSNPQPASQQVGDPELYWGYASGVIATKIPDVAEVVLAERTQTFDKSDASYFHPLMADTQRRLGFHPPFGAFDAAFDSGGAKTRPRTP